MIIDIKRIDKELPLPRHETDGAVAFDLIAREGATIEPGKIALVPGNVIICTPPGYMLMLAARSSLAKKKNLMLANGVGIVDQDYCGPEDEVKLMLLNVGDTPSTIERGERIGQGMFVKIERAEWNEVETLNTPSRGGFGTTGGYATPTA
jgi:dUTP pyrophosphatase